MLKDYSLGPLTYVETPQLKRHVEKDQINKDCSFCQSHASMLSKSAKIRQSGRSFESLTDRVRLVFVRLLTTFRSIDRKTPMVRKYATAVDPSPTLSIFRTGQGPAFRRALKPVGVSSES